MIAYKYKLYRTDKTKHLDRMLREACFVWNHALALQKRYYRLYGKYIGANRMQKHFAKRISRNLLHSQTVQEILQRLDTAYQRFFKRLAKRPPKFRKAKDFSSILFKQGGYSLNGNVLTINSIKKRFKFSLSRPYDGKVKTLTVKRNHIGEFFIVMVLDQSPQSIGKSHNGASVGIDFGLKKYMTMSDGTTVDNPQFLKSGLRQLQRKSRNLSKCVPGSHNRERKRLVSTVTTIRWSISAMPFSGSSPISCASSTTGSSLKTCNSLACLPSGAGRWPTWHTGSLC